MRAVIKQFEALSRNFPRGTSAIHVTTRIRWLSQSRKGKAICTHSYDDVREKGSLQKQVTVISFAQNR